ncbi:MAG TPA: hypothetical protein VH207_03910, partial [Chthoniobacterales bacterium]|nr:hypothetical protein [Chthoniobacterales bacterium]
MTESFWPEILTRLEEGVILLDAEGEIVLANEVGRLLFAFVRPDSAGASADETREIVVPRGEETRRIVLRTSKVADGTLFILRDVTAERALEEVGTEMI